MLGTGCVSLVMARRGDACILEHASSHHDLGEEGAMHMVHAARYWVVADLDDLPNDGNRYEVIDGELLVTPAPTMDHQEALMQLLLRLRPYTQAQKIGNVVFAPADVTFSPKRGVQPDLFVVPLHRGRRPRSFPEVGHLLVAVEVLSPSTARSDRVKKRRVYREEGVEEYWIIDLDARTIERSTPQDDRVEVIDDSLTWKPAGATEAFVLDLDEYFKAVLDE